MFLLVCGCNCFVSLPRDDVGAMQYVTAVFSGPTHLQYHMKFEMDGPSKFRDEDVSGRTLDRRSDNGRYSL